MGPRRQSKANQGPAGNQLTDLADALASADVDRALLALGDFVAAHQIVHDGYRNLVARILTEVFERYGQKAVEDLKEAHGTGDEFLEFLKRPTREVVRLVVAINHWHMSRFIVREDDDKVTLLLQPCGSGGRLINEGRYYRTDQRPYAVMPAGSASTFGDGQFPIYCNHCSEMAEAILQGRGHGFLMEGWTTDHRFGGCRLHVYKSYGQVDRAFFNRLNLTAPGRGQEASGTRLFTETQLREMSQPLAHRLSATLAGGDIESARGLYAETQSGWQQILLPAYKSWARKLYCTIRTTYGDSVLRTIFLRSALDLFVPAQERAELRPAREVWPSFWRCLQALVQTRSVKGTLILEVDPTVLFEIPDGQQLLPDQGCLLCESFNDAVAEPSRAGVAMREGDQGHIEVVISAA